MANSLLDFVMSLVRDPDAAARYAADPSQAIADAHLTGVTSADVNNLIPMVSESMTGADGLGAQAGNVWASGAATAAFDAFGAHPAADPVAAGADSVPGVDSVVDHVITQPDHPVVDDVFADTGIVTPTFDDALSVPGAIEDAPVLPDHDLDTPWVAPTVDEYHHDSDGPSFDLFG